MKERFNKDKGFSGVLMLPASAWVLEGLGHRKIIGQRVQQLQFPWAFN